MTAAYARRFQFAGACSVHPEVRNLTAVSATRQPLILLAQIHQLQSGGWVKVRVPHITVGMLMEKFPVFHLSFI